MDDKNHKDKQVKTPETSRRRFLKTSAATVGAALLGNVIKTTDSPAAEHGQPDLEEIQLLFVQNAKDMVIRNNRLRLIGVSPTTIFFADRPKQIAGHMTTEEFVLDWQEKTGKESFRANPPNAALSVFGGEEVVDVVVTLKNPRRAGGALVYDINVLEEEQVIPSGPAAVFIDPIGRPMSPTSVAGVHRRHRRRRRHRRHVRHAVVH